jgi:hypothetical protein
MEDGLSLSKEEQSSGAAILIGFGVISIVLVGLVIWQPKVSTWIAEAVEAETSTTPGKPDLTRSTAAQMRKPIGPTAWTEVLQPIK